MNIDSFQSALQLFVKRAPFIHFWIEFVSGDRLHVRHPEAVIVRGIVLYHIDPQKHHRLFDSSSVCQLLDEGTPQ